MIDQRLYPDLILGTGGPGQTVAKLGCFECSLLHGFQLRGYQWTVAEFDVYLTKKGAFTNNTMLSASRVTDVLDEVLEGRNETWDDAKLISYLNNKDYIVLGEVSAKGIGGTGQHFVYIDSVDISNFKIVMTYIDDPWGGIENQKVTTRYNAFGNILSLRVFKIKIKGDDMDVTALLTKYKASSVDELDKIIEEGMGTTRGAETLPGGGFLGSARRELTTIKAAQSDILKQAYDQGFMKGVASVSQSTQSPQNTNISSIEDFIGLPSSVYIDSIVIKTGKKA